MSALVCPISPSHKTKPLGASKRAWVCLGCFRNHFWGLKDGELPIIKTSRDTRGKPCMTK